MRKLIFILAFTLLPFSASAASLKDFDGKWGVDLVTTAEKTPGMKPDEELLKLVFTIDAKAKTMRMELPGRPSAPKSFTVEQEGPDGVTVKRDDGRMLKLQPYGAGQLAVGELKDKQLTGVMYFVRPEGHSARQSASDKNLPSRPRPSFAPPAKKKP